MEMCQPRKACTTRNRGPVLIALASDALSAELYRSRLMAVRACDTLREGGYVMATAEPKFDEYIRNSAEFARPVLEQLRRLVHQACPDVVEKMKWSNPSFEHPPKQILAGMAAFKKHCTFGFWKDELLRQNAASAKTLDRLGRMESMADLPSQAAILKLIKAAAKLNEDGVKLPRKSKAKGPPPAVPADFSAALKKARSAAATFEKFPPSHKREYIEWIAEAKKDETRQRRIAQAVEWIAEGKSRNWKYERKS